MSKALQKLEDQQALERWNLLSDEVKEKQKEQSLLILGGIHVADRLANSISSQVMNALIKFKDEKMFLNFGYTRFSEFLDNYENSPMTKHQFYKRRDIFLAEGGQIFDLMNEIGVSIATRKKIAESNHGDIVIDGDTIRIGEEEADLSNLKMVKTLIEKFSNDCRTLTEKSNKKEEKIDELKKEIKTGFGEFEELRRSFDAAKTGTPYEQALGKAVGAFINLSAEARNLTLVEKEKRGRSDIKALWTQMLIVRNALLQDDFVFTDVMNNAPEISPLARKALSEDDDWGDEYEQ